ncbi:hypothetical protein D3C78_1036420 [compost metagenome]
MNNRVRIPDSNAGMHNWVASSFLTAWMLALSSLPASNGGTSRMNPASATLRAQSVTLHWLVAPATLRVIAPGVRTGSAATVVPLVPVAKSTLATSVPPLSLATRLAVASTVLLQSALPQAVTVMACDWQVRAWGA